MTAEKDISCYDTLNALAGQEHTLETLGAQLGMTAEGAKKRINALIVREVIVHESMGGHEGESNGRQPMVYTLGERQLNAKRKLDLLFGEKPFHTPSTLDPKDQQHILDLYLAANGSQGIDLADAFTDPAHLTQGLRVILPLVKGDLCLPFRKIHHADLERYGLGPTMMYHYEESHFELLSEAYTWLREWDVGQTSSYWKGRKGRSRARKATRFMVKERLAYEFHEVCRQELLEDFEREGLGDMLRSEHLGFCGDPYRAIFYACKDQYPKEDFPDDVTAKRRPGRPKKVRESS